MEAFWGIDLSRRLWTPVRGHAGGTAEDGVIGTTKVSSGKHMVKGKERKCIGLSAKLIGRARKVRVE